MIRLEPITPDNWRLGLRVREDQREFVSDSAGMLARAYAYRDSRSQAFVIYSDELPVGMAMYHDWDEADAYDFSQFFIDQRYQGQGYGYEAAGLMMRPNASTKSWASGTPGKPGRTRSPWRWS